MKRFLLFLASVIIPVGGLAQTIGSATVTATGAFNLSTGQVLGLSVQLVGCPSGALPLYQGQPISVLPNQPNNQPFVATGQTVTFTVPGNDQVICSNQTYTTYAVTWKINGMPAAPTATYRFVDNTAVNLSQLTPIAFIPPTINNAAGFSCPSGQNLQGFTQFYEPNCAAVVSTPMPNVTNPGSILTNPLAGNNYVAQGNIYYSQSGDTVSSIETECASLCTYMVTTPQVITLASNHTLSSNVQVEFGAAGKWTVNGAFTLTIPGNVRGSLNRHFAGSSTVKFGASQSLVPVEWFGAVGDGSTDDTAAIQATLNSLSTGQALLQAKIYKVTSALSITSSTVGIKGQGGAVANVNWYALPNASTIMNSSASADTIDVAGASLAANVYGNRFDHFNLLRSVAPTGTATGLSFNHVSGAEVDTVISNDSVRGFYLHNFNSAGVGYITNSGGELGENGVAETSGTYYEFYIDSSDGQGSASVRLRNDTFANGSTGTAVGYGIYATGAAINDLMVYGFETASADYGVALVQTGTPGQIGSSDIHFYGGINDGCQVNCYLISGLTAGAGAGVEINGGYATTQTLGAPHIDIESSSGVRVNGVQFGIASGGVNTCINVANSSNVALFGNLCNGVVSAGFLISNSTGVTATANTLSGVNDVNGLISLQNSSFNTITGNTLNGTGASLIVDANSSNNAGILTNAIAGTLNAISVLGPNPTLLTGHLNSLQGTPTIAVGGGAGTGATASLAAGSNDTRGTIIIACGTSTLGGNQNLATVTFAKPYATTPIVVFTMNSGTTSGAAAGTYYVVGGTGTFQLNAQTGVAASSTIVMNYVIIG